MSLLVNGKAYDWGSVGIDLPGLPMIDVQEISYNDELEKEAVYGRGNMPRGYGTGNYKASAKLTLLREDYEVLITHCKDTGATLYGLVIPKIVVNYADDGDPIHTDVLDTVTITKSDHKGAQGDKKLTVSLDLLVVRGIIRDGVKAV